MLSTKISEKTNLVGSVILLMRKAHITKLTLSGVEKCQVAVTFINNKIKNLFRPNKLLAS